MREIRAALDFASRRRWHNWLEKNHATKKEALLIIYKRGPRNATFSPHDALEEALSFGWIDGWFKPIDANRWVIRYTPRRKGSSWSEYNIARAWMLLREGKMTPAGIAKVPSDVIRVWEDYHPSPIVIDSKGARKGEVKFTDGKDYLSMVEKPALTP